MSNTAQDFIQAVRDNKDLRFEVEEIGQDITALVEFAKSKGYAFSEADFTAAVRDAGYNIEAELNDADLEAVAGGTMGPTNANNECAETELDCPSTDWPDC